MTTNINTTPYQLHVGHLNAGIYLMNVLTNDDQKKTLKFIKI